MCTRSIFLVGVVSSLLIAPAFTNAGDGSNSWIGLRVMPKWGCMLRVGHRVLDQMQFDLPYVVQKVSSSRCCVGDDMVGWVDRRDVVPLAEAPAYYTEFIRRNPDSAWAYLHRGAALLATGQLENALNDETQAIQLDPRSPVAYSNRAISWNQKGEVDKAIQDCTESIRLDPSYPFPYVNRAYSWCKKGEYEKALQDYNELVRLEPARVFGYNGRAWLRATCPDARLRDGKEAIESARKACEMSRWEAGFCIGTFAAACAESGDFGAAIHWEEKAISMTTDASLLSIQHKNLELFRDHKPDRE
jgi:tetratricopeptide (TPR) repeat protein